MKFLKAVKRGMNNFGQHISIIVNSALLTVVYILGVGLTAIFAKLGRKRFLELKLSQDSYWTDLNVKKQPLQEYYRQF